MCIVYVCALLCFMAFLTGSLQCMWCGGGGGGGGGGGAFLQVVILMLQKNEVV